MRSLKSKIILLCQMFENQEPGKAYYREKRWKIWEEGKEKIKRELHKQRQIDIKNKKKQFYLAQKKKITRDFSNRISINDYSPSSSINNLEKFRELRNRSETYPYLNLTNQDLLSHPSKIKLLCERLKPVEIDLVEPFFMLIF